ncbi:hypothetical protein P3L10_001807 [Capsicum annuum]|uniref:uncharacterized protein LOC124890298 n=1 Tax=Capsicum annuum TaxID=4072 RepID=UPI001FB04F03|nr:uncharacterized protein LOC124890298 [Capsicum annuum]
MKLPAIIGAPGSSTVHRRQPLLHTTTTATPPPMTAYKRKSEVAGRTAAECVTVCCCIPCAMMNFLVLVVYKIPTGLCQKLLRKNKQKRLLKNESKCGYSGAAVEHGKESKNFIIHGGDGGSGDCIDGRGDGRGGGKTAAESKMEMWGRFYEGGFWRNSSEKKED